MKVSFIGAGNVATHLSKALAAAGNNIVGVFTRTLASSQNFAEIHNCAIARTLSELPEADLYVFSIKDDALAEVVEDFGKLHRDGLCLHTAGSVPMEVFQSYVSRYGVLYPMQTFSKNRTLNFSEVPLFIEANSDSDITVLSDLAHSISKKVYPLNSESRQLLHLAAVFACNFSNHCFAIAADILHKANLPGDLLLPLIEETCAKLHDIPAVLGQTGPAVRFDQKVMNYQLGLLGNDELRKDIYQLMSRSIHEYALACHNSDNKNK